MIFREGNGDVERLTVGGLVVGMLPDVSYQKEQVLLKSGDLLFVYSDGVSEAMNLQDEEFGEERIQNVVSKNKNLPITDLRDAILKEIADFVGEAPQNDDLTMVLARIL